MEALPSNKDFWSPVSSLKTIPVTENLMGFLGSKQQVTQLGLLSREGNGEGALWLYAVCPCETSPDKDRISPVAFPPVKHLIILLHTCQLHPAQGTVCPGEVRPTPLPPRQKGTQYWPRAWLFGPSSVSAFGSVHFHETKSIDSGIDRQTKTCSLPQQYLPRQP